MPKNTTRVVVTTAAAALLLAACTGGSSPDLQQPAPVELSVKGIDGATIGMIVSSTSDPGQGDDYVSSSAGAEVAVYRLNLADQDVTLKVVDDRGESADAVSAVDELVAAGASGIVLASSGDHLTEALSAASAAQVPVIAPYLRTDAELPDGVYVTGPSEGQVADDLTTAVSRDSPSQPILLSSDEVPAPAIDAVRTITVGRDSIDAAVDAVGDAVEDTQADSVVISASAPLQARVVAALQGQQSALRTFLTPEALSPQFADDLLDNSGTLAGRFVTVGTDASDTKTLGAGQSADAAAAFFAALRLAADDENLSSVVDGAPFSSVAPLADLASHDAVVALAAAVSKAGSQEPARVTAALAGLEVAARNGLVGPALTFDSDRPLTADAVVPLYATTQSPGVRPTSTDGNPGLFWFRLPEDAS